MRKLPAGVRKRKNGLLEKRFSANGNRYSVYGRTMRQLNEKEERKKIDYYRRICAERKYNNRPVF